MAEPHVQQQAEPLTVPSTGPRMGSTLGKQPRPEAVKAFRAMVRKELREQRQADSQSE